MIQALLLSSSLLLQDPKPAAKTVEERLKELDEKIVALEKKHRGLVDENAAMEKRIADGKATRERFARQPGAEWVKRYSSALELTEKQSGEIEQAWYGWSKEDQEKPYDAARWPAREEALKAKLRAEQVPRLARKVREDQEQNVRASLPMFSRAAKLVPDKAAALEKIVMGKIRIEEGILLPQAHPREMAESWGNTLSAIESSLPELGATFSEQEIAALRGVLAQWKPKPR